MKLPRINAQRTDEDTKISKFSWPGGYPLFAVMSDGEAMCIDCVNTEDAITDDPTDTSGWRVVTVDANWEDPDLFCCNCNERIESAYAEDDK